MNNPATELETFLELEERHDDLLERIDALDKQVEKVLAQWTVVRGETAEEKAA